MEHRILFSLAVLMLACPLLVAQDVPPRPPVVPPAPTTQDMTPPMPRMNPSMLLRMRNQLTFELQQTQRTLGFLDPADTQLSTTLKEQQTDLVKQLKDIDTQLKAQGVPVENLQDPTAAAPGMPGAALPETPKATDPTLVPGGSPQPPADPNLLIQQRLTTGMPGAMPGGMSAGMHGSTPQPGMPGMFPGTPMVNPMLPPQTPYNLQQPGGTMPYPPVTPTMTPPTPPTQFDPDQAWANSPWVPQPSKELTELKQTVETLRREIGEMKESVKALEAQIQLLNRNILLNQQPAK